MYLELKSGTNAQIEAKVTTVNWASGAVSVKQNFIWPIVSKELLIKEGANESDVALILDILPRLCETMLSRS